MKTLQELEKICDEKYEIAIKLAKADSAHNGKDFSQAFDSYMDARKALDARLLKQIKTEIPGLLK